MSSPPRSPPTTRTSVLSASTHRHRLHSFQHQYHHTHCPDNPRSSDPSAAPSISRIGPGSSGSPPSAVQTPPHLPHLSGSSATFASLSRHHLSSTSNGLEDPAAAAAAAAATSSRLAGLGSGMSIGGSGASGGSGSAGSGSGPGPGPVNGVVSCDLQAIECLKEAVMQSQNRARDRSRLHHATFASNSPPLSTAENYPQELLHNPTKTTTTANITSPATTTTTSTATIATATRVQTSPSSPRLASASAAVARSSQSAKLNYYSSTTNVPAQPRTYTPSSSSPTMMSPAYPFPQMSRMRSISSSTIGASFNSPGVGPLDKLLPSGTPTPASVAFHPSGSKPASSYENPDFPTPNMYELTLLLHSEPGVEAFWSNVVKIATMCYKAERVTLTLPSDSTDLENTPWGQKATFNMAEDDKLSLAYMGDDRGRVGDPDGGDYSEEDDGFQDGGQMAMMDCKREMDLDATTEPIQIDTNPDSPFGPVTVEMQEPPQDATNNSDWISVTSGASPREAPASPAGGMDSAQAPEQDKTFWSDESEVRGKVFPTLQPLNCEADALLDETGVSRVLQRGKMVVLSREYRDVKTHLVEKEKRRKDMESTPPKASSDKKMGPPTAGIQATTGLGKLDMPTSPFRAPPQPPTPLFFVKGTRRKRKPLPKDNYAHNPVLQYYSTQQHLHHVQSRAQSPNRASSYEEYEQPITSPWSQSPAPSPAPRPDPSENPFFASPPKVDEETFNPAMSSPVYSAQEPVNAIGCESSWTVIHIPLVHPSQSKGLNLAGNTTGAATAPSGRMFSATSISMDDIGRQQKKKAPIAILSMLSPVIPYPSNLIHSLSHFAPLVATAFSLASTHSSVLGQLNSFRKKRTARRPGIPRQLSYLSSGFASTDTLRGSVTSPSDSSSAFTISNVASPMWDNSPAGTASQGPSSKSESSQSVTPFSPLNGGGDDGYFPRVGQQPIFSRQHSGAVPTVVPKGEDPESYTSKEKSHFPEQPTTAANDFTVLKRSNTIRPLPPMSTPDSDGTTPTQMSQDKGKQVENNFLAPPRSPAQAQASTEPKPRSTVRQRRVGANRGHSYLHSYGADYATTFQSLGTAAFVLGRRKGSARRKADQLNIHEMPPPSNRLLRTIIDSIPVHVFTAVPGTGVITWVNARMLAYRGTTAENFMKAPWDALHPEDRDEYLRRWGIAIRKGEPFSHQMRVRRFDGDYRWFMVRAVPLRDQRGIIVHWFGTNMDIHDQRLAEVDAARQAEMAESEHKYRSLANSSPQIVFAATANDGITFANTQWLGYSGQTLEEALKLGFMGYVHPSDRHKCCLPGNGSPFSSFPDGDKASFPEQGRRYGHEWSGGAGMGMGNTKMDDDKPTFSTELRLKDKYGNYRWHLVRCVSVDSNADNAEGLWFGTCTDINDHKLLEQKLKEANEAAQRTMDSKTRFLANMSHEIRTPLIGISGMVTFLLDTPLNGEQLDYCHTISQSSDGLLSVINDILDLSKVEAGMMRLNPEWFRMNSLVEDAHELLSTMAIAKDLELNFIVETDVPPVVCGDRVRLRQVLLNIIGNAIKFTNKGEVFSRCSVDKTAEGLKEDEVMIKFECHDTGPGFDAKDEEYMFKPFSQIDGSSTRAHGGSGLGLVISRQLVELHGGKLTARSEKGKGSTFIGSARLKIPTTPSETTLTPSNANAPSPSGALPNAIGHVLESGRFVDSPPALSHTEESTPTISSSSTATSIRSIASAHPDIPNDPPLGQYSIPSPTDPASMRLFLPSEAQQKYNDSQDPSSKAVDSSIGKATIPPMFSILIVSQQPFSRIAISHHIKVTLPKNIPNKITPVEKFSECRELIAGDDPVVFTHLVISLPEHSEIIDLISRLLENPIHYQTTVLVLTNPTQRQAILQNAPDTCDKLGIRLQFIYKPIKPSRFGDVFDPAKERDASMDRYRDSAQQVVETQKRVFSRLEHDVGNRGYTVLLVEDNKVNQKVLLRFLDKVGLHVETASDGEECIEKVFSKQPGYYGLILCDLHMPRKDGFQATAEIRQWEKERGVPPVPIVALSANVMSDVADKCTIAGFSRYVTKPVDFKELSMTIKELLPSSDHTSPGSPLCRDREIEDLKERTKRELEEAEAQRVRDQEAAEAAEAIREIERQQAIAEPSSPRSPRAPISPRGFVSEQPREREHRRQWARGEGDERAERDRHRQR